jgi:hypothetical protein
VGGEFGSVFLELRAVGGEREFVDRAGGEVPRERGDQRHDAAPDQRLAAGEAQLAHALGDEGGAEAVEFPSESTSAFGRNVIFSDMQ